MPDEPEEPKYVLKSSDNFEDDFVQHIFGTKGSFFA